MELEDGKWTTRPEPVTRMELKTLASGEKARTSWVGY